MCLCGFSNTSTDDVRDVGTGRGNDWLARLASGKRFARSDWSLAYRRRDLERAGVGRDSSLQSLLAEFGYRLNRRFRLTGSVGYEDEDYGGDQRAQRGPTGSVGLVYSPGERTSISGSIGQRVFHQKFGYGRISAVEGNRLHIDFDKAGSKKVIDSFVKPA